MHPIVLLRMVLRPLQLLESHHPAESAPPRTCPSPCLRASPL